LSKPDFLGGRRKLLEEILQALAIQTSQARVSKTEIKAILSQNTGIDTDAVILDILSEQLKCLFLGEL